MDNFTSLKSSLQAIQQIINLDVVPAFDDLSNNSLIFNDLISVQNNIQLELNNINSLIESNLIKGDTGLQGIQGLSGNDGYTPIKGIDYFDGSNATSFIMSQSVVTTGSDSSYSSTNLSTLLGLEITDVVANALYELEVYISFTSPVGTTGLKLGLQLPTDAVFYGEIVVPVTNVSSTIPPARLSLPNSSISTQSVISAGVASSNTIHTAFIRGIVKMNAFTTSTLFFPLVASEVDGSLIKIKAGSFLVLKRIA